MSDPEAIALSNSLCDVCDYHRINLSEAGGPYGLYLALALATFQIYAPRLKYVALQKKTAERPEPATVAASPGEMQFGGTVDFSNDVQH